MGNTNNFEFTGRLKRLFLILMGLGAAAVVAGVLINPEISAQRVWANFLVNTIFFLGIGLLGLFFVATHTMAFGGWHVLVRRIPEALSTFIPVGVGLLLIIVAGAVTGSHHLYHWTDTFLVKDTVTVGDLRAYEAGLHHEGGEEHHEDASHDAEHDADHGTEPNAGHGTELDTTHDVQHDTIHDADHDAGHPEDHSTSQNSETAVPVLAASVSQDAATGHDDHGTDGTHATGEGDDAHLATGSDTLHTDTLHATDHAAAEHAGDHASDEAKASHGAADGQGEAHGDERYDWYAGKVSAQYGNHHGHEMYAAQFASAAEGDQIANPHFDKLLAHKAPYLNKSFFAIRFAAYGLIWISLFYLIRRASLREDKEGGLVWYKRSKMYSATYMVLFGITSSMMAWDFLMSIDAHWFSTLYGWYNAASLWVATVASITLILIYLKNQGYLPQVNENHLHDLGKYMFGFSVFWTYLFFSQYMLIWYANLPEETFYFHMRNGDPAYRALFFINLGMNFFVPLFVLITRNAKRRVGLMAAIATSLVLTHWLDLFLEVMPGTVGTAWGIGLVELGMLAAFAGLFLFVVFRSLSRASLVPQKHPFYLESVNHHT